MLTLEENNLDYILQAKRQYFSSQLNDLGIKNFEIEDLEQSSIRRMIAEYEFQEDFFKQLGLVNGALCNEIYNICIKNPNVRTTKEIISKIRTMKQYKDIKLIDLQNTSEDRFQT